MASVVMTSVLATLYLFLSGSLQCFGSMSTAQQLHSTFLSLQEIVGRDVRHTSRLVQTIVLDGTAYNTETGPLADSLVLQLPAVNATGQPISDVYDFVIYELVNADGTIASLQRRVFANRDQQGRPSASAERSVRSPESRVVANELLLPNQDGTTSPLFALDPPMVTLAHTSTMTVTLRATDLIGRHVPQTYTAQFHLRNGS
jgi:hypothetical protein